MEIYTPRDFPLKIPHPVATLGNFDGVHLGHQALIKETLHLAREMGGTPLAVTFEPHPRRILRPEDPPPLLTTFEERLELFEAYGLSRVLVIPFGPELASLPPEEFVEEYLVDGLGLKGLVVGFNYRFGHARRGDAALLKRLGEKWGFEVRVVPPQKIEGLMVSSSLIRELLLQGEVERAARLLGRPYRLKGRVVPGEARGRTLGFPTANLEPPPEKLLPARGVYAVRVQWAGKWWKAVMNLGQRPTFGGRRLCLEVHLFDFQGDLYGETLTVEFMRFLRPERKFASPAELRAQILEDCRQARKALTF
ncbi:bifunctional riboflavin kinase/FAD synthetase [Thermosulfurimonas marina]|uniref:Riboflavin biosynthesis protein n=1 Tax=Thermosulfurimonas marina TaxID=2047767 RepID=A0A6H1WT80_9BACT|nr:bifunctional riboflavin kinase/FAD synthetase [Thermosulfurimonas marina]QJA06359.1 bifunctional riboflavin kinase/FAD synthetase [Thermosulfurimonas marina]